MLAGCLLMTMSIPFVIQAEVKLEKKEDRVRVELNGKLFTEYRFGGVPRPFLYPILGPGELPMTRDWPMKDVPGEDHDHPHHRSLWFAHGDVNGVDFWSETEKAGKIVHQEFVKVESGRTSGVVETRNRWLDVKGTTICTDTRTVTFYPPGANDERMLDFAITIHASQGDLVFGDTKEGTMAIRLAETMRLKGGLGKGRIVTSGGDKDGGAWGKSAKWCSYYGPVKDQIVGVAIFDAPSNPRHPTWWHVRDYGLFAANPFGKHDFEKLADKTAGNLTVPKGKSVTFKYRFLFHKGDTAAGKVAAAYDRFAASVK
jgi:hypothetical protein